MQGYLFLAFNLLVTFALYSYLYDPIFEYSDLHPTTQCINFTTFNQSLCAQCISRTSLPNYSKGIVITHNQPYSILKLNYQYNYLTCRELLQFIDYNQPANKQITFGNDLYAFAIVAELKGNMQEIQQHRSIIEPGFQEVVVYGWYDLYGEKGTKMDKVNEQNIKSIIHFYFYLLNFVLFTIIIGKFINPKIQILDHHKWILITIIILLELLTSPYLHLHFINRHYLLQMIRLLSFTFILIRLKMETYVIYGYSVLGLLLLWHPLTLTIYVYIGVLLIVLQSLDRPELKQFWIYIFVAQLLLSVNYLVWYLVFRYQADSFCRIIELSQLIFNLLAFVLIEDKKIQTFKEYHDSETKERDPQLRRISLMNQDDDEDQEDIIRV